MGRRRRPEGGPTSRLLPEPHTHSSHLTLLQSHQGPASHMDQPPAPHATLTVTVGRWGWHPAEPPLGEWASSETAFPHLTLSSTGVRSGAAEKMDVGAAPVMSTGLAGSGSAWARQAPQLVCVLCSERAASGSWQAPGSRTGTDHGALTGDGLVTITDLRQTRGTLSRSTPGSRA